MTEEKKEKPDVEELDLDLLDKRSNASEQSPSPSVQELLDNIEKTVKRFSEKEDNA